MGNTICGISLPNMNPMPALRSAASTVASTVGKIRDAMCCCLSMPEVREQDTPRPNHIEPVDSPREEATKLDASSPHRRKTSISKLLGTFDTPKNNVNQDIDSPTKMRISELIGSDIGTIEFSPDREKLVGSMAESIYKEFADTDSTNPLNVHDLKRVLSSLAMAVDQWTKEDEDDKKSEDDPYNGMLVLVTAYGYMQQLKESKGLGFALSGENFKQNIAAVMLLAYKMEFDEPISANFWSDVSGVNREVLDEILERFAFVSGIDLITTEDRFFALSELLGVDRDFWASENELDRRLSVVTNADPQGIEIDGQEDPLADNLDGVAAPPPAATGADDTANVVATPAQPADTPRRDSMLTGYGEVTPGRVANRINGDLYPNDN